MRVSSHTIALYSGFPVLLLQHIVVSRWFVIPTAFTVTAKPFERAPCVIAYVVLNHLQNISGAPHYWVECGHTQRNGADCACSM